MFRTLLIVALFAALYLVRLAVSVAIPNKQIGKAEVECGDDYVDVVFLTKRKFQGRIFAVGFANDPDCVTKDTGGRSTQIRIDKKKCGTVSVRSENPPGIYVTVKVMLSFHKQFITKVDKGYAISCFYMETEKTVTFPLSVSVLGLSGVTNFAEMPRCIYEVLDPKKKTLQSVVTVGQRVLHKWSCISPTAELWCMRVHSCFIEDERRTQVRLVDEDGCAIDKFLLDNLDYRKANDLVVQKEAHAFKFADRVVVNFQCSVLLDIRKDRNCPKPRCPRLRRSRFRRQLIDNTTLSSAGGTEQYDDESAVNVDVRSNEIDVLDPRIDWTADGDERALLQLREAVEFRSGAGRQSSADHCVSFTLLAPLVAFFLTAILSLLVVLVDLRRRLSFNTRR